MLTKLELEDFQNKLLDRRVQIEKNLKGTSLELEQMSSLELNDEGDHASVSAEAIVDNAILIQQRQELNELELALAKIREGTYGICEMCEEEIQKPRLEVKNFARFCITCREITENEMK